MPGETDLAVLIASMRPTLQPGVHVFATIARGQSMPAGLDPVMTFVEPQGMTLVIGREAAERAGLPATFPCRMITLEVHSSLEAVGFLAAITTLLAAAGIAVNPVSGYHHDHLFVPEARAAEAIEVLHDLAAGVRVD